MVSGGPELVCRQVYASGRAPAFVRRQVRPAIHASATGRL